MHTYIPPASVFILRMELMLRLASGRSDSKCILIYYYTHCKYSPGVCTINTEQGCVYICKEITQRTSCERLDFEGRIDASIGFGAEQSKYFLI